MQLGVVREALDGNVEAFGSLYDRYAGLIRAICHDESGRDLHRAQDLCQEVFLRGYRSLGTLKEPEKFAGWLVGIARLVCQEGRRRRLHDRNRFVADPPEQCAESRDVGTTEEAKGLLAAIAGLPKRERLALHLFYLQENPVEDARQVLHLSRSGFYRLLSRAGARLKRRIKRTGIDWEGNS